MRVFAKLIGLLYLLLSVSNSFYAQTVIFNEQEQTINSTVTGDKIYYSNEGIKMTPNFTYTPNSSENFKAAINPIYVSGTGTDLLGGGGYDDRTLDFSLPVGSVLSNGNASGSGYSHSISFEVPPGTGNVQPNIGLNYYNGSGKSVVGKGWSFSATSVITRTGKNYYNHGEIREIKLDGQDPLVLDGTLLIDMGNGVYRTEQEQFSEAVIDNGVFTVQTRDGMVYTYGQSSDYKITASNGQVLTWFLSRVQDRFGNYMTYHYTRHGNEFLLTEIRYTGNVVKGITPYNSVKFEYSIRKDKGSIYIAGMEIQSNHLLSKVRTYAEGQLVRTYVMRYTNELESYLIDVSEENAQGEAFNPLMFRYGEHQLMQAGTLKPSNNASTSQQPSGYFLIDYNGDGKKELLDFGALSIYGLYIKGLKYDVDKSAYIDLQFDDEGNRDPMQTTKMFLPHTDDDFVSSYDLDLEDFRFFINSNNLYNQSSFSLPSDYNGDGLEDIYIIEKRDDGYFYVTFLLGAPDGLHFMNEYYEERTAVSQDLQTTTHHRIYKTDVRFKLGLEFPYILPGDYNGDGKMELMWLESYHEGTKLSGFSMVADLGPAVASIISLDASTISKSSTFVIEPTYEKFREEGVLFLQQGDFNGDGITDFLTLEHVDGSFGTSTDELQGVTNLMHYNASNNTYSVERSGMSSPMRIDDNIFDERLISMGDFNGDGKTDVLYNSNKIAYSTGKAMLKRTIPNNISFLQQYWDEDLVDPNNCSKYFKNSNDFVVGDFNGDGRDDFMALRMRDFKTTEYTLYYSQGENFVPFVSGTYQGVLPGKWAKVTDVDGNGVQDVVGDIPGASICKFIHDPIFLNVPHNYVDALQTVSDGYGRTTHIKYENLTHTPNYTKGTGAQYPLVDLTIPLKVPVKITQPDGVGGNMITEYRYAGLKYHAKGRGLLGFESTEVRNLTTNFREISRSQLLTDVMLLAPKGQQTFQGSTLINENTTTAQVHKFDSQRFFIHYPTVVSKDHITGRQTLTTTSYTDFMLPPIRTEVSVRTLSGQEIEKNTTEITYRWTDLDVGRILPAPLTQRVTIERTGDAAYVREVHNTYMSKVQLETQTTDPSKPKAVTSTYSYDDFGNALSSNASADGLTNRRVISEYEPKGRFAIRAKNSLQHEVSQAYDVRYGQVTSAKDVNQLESFYRYDNFGRIQEAEGPTGKKANVRYGWNTDSQIPALYFIESKAEGAPTTVTWYDILGRAVLVKTDGLNKPIYQRTHYNNKGQVVLSTSPYHEGDEIVETTYTYDDLGRVIAVSNDIGTTTSTYELVNGNYKVTTVSPAGQIYSVETDAAGKQVKATDAGGTLEYSYYSNGQLKDVRLAGQVMSSMTYDEYGRQTTLIDANAGMSEYLYNAYGELQQQKDANGNIYQFTYDELGRVTERQGPEGSTFYSYYNSGNAIGAIETVTSANGFSTNYEYDDLARLNKTTEQVGVETFVYQMQYDDFNRPVQITYPGGLSLYKTYTGKGYLSEVAFENGGAPIWMANTMNAYNQYTQYSLGNGLAVNKTYDKHGVLKTIQTNGVYDLKYNIDLRTGNLLSREDAEKTKKEVFTYDVLDRLTKVQTNNVTTLEMSYLANGNIQQKSDVGNYAYHDSKPNAVQYVTDRVTGAISEQEQHISYTPFLKVESIEEGDWKAQFSYDANYSRKQVDFYNTTTGQLEKTHYYSGAYQKITTPQGDVKEITYLACGDGLTAVHVKDNSTPQSADGELYYVHSDHQGSIVALTNQQQQVVVEQIFDPWGKRTITPLTGEPEGAFNWLRGYTGHEHLQEFDLVNMNGRLYDPTLGRMLSPDNFVQSPFYSQNYNRYSYVYNNPLKYTDPTGYISQHALDMERRRREEAQAFGEQKDREFLEQWATYNSLRDPLAEVVFGGGGGGGGISQKIVGDSGYEDFQMHRAQGEYGFGLNENGQVVRAFTPKATMLTFSGNPNAPGGIDDLRVHYSNGKVVQGSYEMLQFLRTLGSDGDEIKARLLEMVGSGWFENNFSFFHKHIAFVPYEGVGAKGSYDVYGNVRISQQDGGFNLYVYAKATSQATSEGSLTFKGTVKLLVNNKVVATSALGMPKGPHIVTNDGASPIGSANFSLPQGSNPSNTVLQLTVGYFFQGHGGIVVPIPTTSTTNIYIPRYNPNP